MLIYVLGAPGLFLVPLSQKNIFDFFSPPGQNKSSLRGSYGGGGQDEASPLEPLLLRQGEQRLCHIPYGAKTTGISGEVAVLWNGVRFPALSVDPLRGKLKGHCGNCHWRLCTGTGNDKCAGTRAYWKGICFGFLFPNSVRNPPAWIRCLFWALLCKWVHLTVSFPHEFEICWLQILSVKTIF